MDKSAQNNEPNIIRNRFSKILDIFLLVLGVVAFAVAGVLFYQKVYLDPFYVNGQSMYPTFNKDTEGPNGNKFGKLGLSVYEGCSHVDYGFMNCHKKALDKLERFDVVVTFESADKSVQLIKRVVGLPGETIRFTSTNSRDPANGDLYVKEGDDFILVEQPIDSEYKVASASHPYPSYDITLAEDEYYVLGDNRGHSQDSRAYGNIKRDWLIGKVIYIAGHCSIRQDKDGENQPYRIRYKWPRFF